MKLDVQSLMLSYGLLIIKIIISIFLLTMFFVYFTNETYAYYNIIILYTSYTGFLHFGYNDAIQLKYRQKNLEDISSEVFMNELYFATFIQIVLMIAIALLFDGLLSLTIIIIFPFKNMYWYFINFYIGIGKIVRANLYLLMQPLLMLIIFYIYKEDINNNIISGAIIISFAFIYVLMYIDFLVNIKSNLSKNQKTESFKIKENYTVGFIILLGNFFLIIYMTLDKFFLQNDYQMLGQYSYIMLIITSLIIILNPLRNMLYSAISEDIKFKSIFKLNIYLNFIVLIIILIIDSIILLPVIPISESIKFGIVLMFPVLFVIVDGCSVISDVLKIRDYKKYLITNFLITIINFIIYVWFLYFNNSFTLLQYMLIVHLSYFIIMLINSIFHDRKKFILNLVNTYMFYIIYYIIIYYIIL